MDSHISFEIKDITEEELNSNNYKIFYNNMNSLLKNYIGINLTKYNIRRLFSEIENIINEYKYNNPKSTFKLIPNHRYAFEERNLNTKDIKKLHKKYCEDIHIDKEIYNQREINNMLFDLKTVNQIFSYEQILYSYSEGEIPFRGTIKAEVRIYQYIGEQNGM